MRKLRINEKLEELEATPGRIVMTAEERAEFREMVAQERAERRRKRLERRRRVEEGLTPAEAQAGRVRAALALAMMASPSDQGLTLPDGRTLCVESVTCDYDHFHVERLTVRAKVYPLIT